MTRTARWLVGIVAAFLALLIASIVVLMVIVDPNSYRDEIEGAVERATARDFRLRGEIDIGWFPWLALETGQAELGNPRGFADGPPLAKWTAADVGVRLLPLLRGRLVVDRIRFEGLDVHLHVDEDGRSNWAGLMDRNEREAMSDPTIPQNAGLEIRDGTLAYTDARTATRLELSAWDFDIGAFSSGKPVAIRSEFRFRDLPVALRADALTVDVDALRISAPAWAVRLGEARLEGALTSEERLQRFEGSVRGEAPSLRALLAALGMGPPRTRDAEAMGPLRLAGSWRYDAGTIMVKPLEVKLDDTALRGTLGRTASDAMWTFELKGDRIDLDRYRGPEDEAGKPFELPVEQMRAAKLRGTLTFDTARLAGVDANDVKLNVVTGAPQ